MKSPRRFPPEVSRKQDSIAALESRQEHLHNQMTVEEQDRESHNTTMNGALGHPAES